MAPKRRMDWIPGPSKRTRAVVRVIRQEPGITYAEIAEKVQADQRYVQRLILVLVAAGVVRRESRRDRDGQSVICCRWVHSAAA